jgi:glutamate/tyrosine decarboxylase-like PLP-dependent enzyme
MAANQSIQEEAQNNGGVEVVKKVNINLACLKLNDSKKRL